MNDETNPSPWPAPAGPPTREQVLACLDKVVDPCSAASASPMSIVEMGLIRDLRISPDGDVSVFLRLSAPGLLLVAFQSMVSVGDTYFVSRLGTAPLATGRSQSVFQSSRVINQDGVGSYTWNPIGPFDLRTTAGVNYTDQRIRMTSATANGRSKAGRRKS